jgi:hypothetical protein
MGGRMMAAAGAAQAWRARMVEAGLVARSMWLREAADVCAPPALEPFTLVWPRAYSWAPFSIWFEPLREGLAALARMEGAQAMRPPVRNCEIIDVRYGGATFPVVIDCGDSSDIDEAQAARALVYFKMQYRRAGYGRPNVVPGGYGPGMGVRIDSVLPALRALRDRREFEHEVHARFGAAFGYERRKPYLDALAADGRFRLTGGFKMLRPSAFLAEVARARVLIDLPGQGDFCFRFVDYLAVGACVVAARHGVRMPVDLVDGRDVLFVDTPAQAADACAHLLAEPARIEAMAQAARAYYDNHLTKSAQAAYYAREIRARLPGAPFP